ncbi:hypothetical protein DUNSADRAFT_9842 [Dunaliella salina]|uniref:C3H1-type domain-containing protein n=1 Tax=Dunaliella salina TaxID=3046 RepID=A0ABQ7GGJ3_DUNSA|nr:hypothetical protein DUNSADRAFT_9842 [Dunaliella salina]|eukprot:KAF5833735.1 hypothetical protein DUNSADRAFT_9842 [Dunaliella salina]
MDWGSWEKRAARKQVDEQSLQRAMAEKARKESSGRNIWTGKAVRGPQGDGGPPGRRARELSMYRCVPQVDCGRTKGSEAKQRMFCLYFAKGCCSQGSACIYLHRVPTADDEAYHSKDMGADIFGREKRAEHEGYRKGAGTFERDNRTLYVNYEGAGSYELPKIRELIHDNFCVWGPIKSIYIAHKKTLAFVRYEWRSSAEFAKEAMHKQKLLGSTQAEILTCRWSNEDPNPAAVVQKKRDYADAFENAAMASWDALPEEQRQARIMQLQLMAAMRNRQVVSDYPNTDAQYGEAADAYPDTDAQYAECDPSDQQGADTEDGRHLVGDPVAALCGGGEAALASCHHETLYPASDAHCYNIDQQQQQQQQYVAYPAQGAHCYDVDRQQQQQQQQQCMGSLQGDSGCWYGQEAGCSYGAYDSAYSNGAPGYSWYGNHYDQGDGVVHLGGAEYAGTGAHAGYMGYGNAAESSSCEDAGGRDAEGDGGGRCSVHAQECRGKQEGEQGRGDLEQHGSKEGAAGLCDLLAGYASDDDGGSGQEDKKE